MGSGGHENPLGIHYFGKTINDHHACSQVIDIQRTIACGRAEFPVDGASALIDSTCLCSWACACHLETPSSLACTCVSLHAIGISIGTRTVVVVTHTRKTKATSSRKLSIPRMMSSIRGVVSLGGSHTRRQSPLDTDLLAVSHGASSPGPSDRDMSLTQPLPVCRVDLLHDGSVARM